MPKPTVGKERLVENPSGLLVVRYEMTDEQRKQRREDNKLAKKARATHRRRKQHGRQ
jgi:hypothetical protein